MEKEKVLEIEFQKVWDKWAWRIVKNEIPFSDKSKEIEFNNIKMKKDRTETIFIYDCVFDKFENMEDYILIDDQEKTDLEKFIDYINKKYRKRWRGKRSDKYFSIFGDSEISETTDNYFPEDQRRYEWGNYFKTLEEAEKVKAELDKFWEKVRNGEIGGDK